MIHSSFYLLLLTLRQSSPPYPHRHPPSPLSWAWQASSGSGSGWRDRWSPSWTPLSSSSPPPTAGTGLWWMMDCVWKLNTSTTDMNIQFHILLSSWFILLQNLEWKQMKGLVKPFFNTFVFFFYSSGTGLWWMMDCVRKVNESTTNRNIQFHILL